VSILYFNLSEIVLRIMFLALLRDDAQTARVQVTTKPTITTYTAPAKQIGQMRVG